MTARNIFVGLITALLMQSAGLFAQGDSQAWEGADPQQRSGGCPFFDLTPNPTPPTCNGFTDGVAAVNVSGGVGPFTYLWVGGPTTPTWPNVGAGTYTVIVFDQGQGGAPCNIDVFVNEPGPLVVFAMNATPPTCFGACNGSAFPIVIGGNGGYSYSWDSGETGFSANQLCNPFTLTVTDQAGCVLDTTYTFVNEPEDIIITADTTDITCHGDNDGAISISVEGGNPGYTYSWTGPGGFSSASQDISGLAPGTYNVLVVDQNNCEATASFTIEEPEPIEVTADITDNLCAEDNEGAIDLSITGGSPPYDLSWSGPNGFTSNQENIANLASGAYDLVLTDAAGCEFTASYTVSEPDPIDIELSADDVSCFGQNDGSIDAAVSGGTPDYSFAWTGPGGFTGTTANISNLVPGTYTLVVTDANGCEDFQSIDIVEPEPLDISADVLDITCNGAADGAIVLAVDGGTPNYTYSWTGPGGFSSSNQNLTDLQAGTYVVTVTDANGCEASEAFTVNEPAPIEITGDVDDNLCAEDENGSITIQISGGTPNYSISWTGPDGFTSTESSISNLASGSYAVLVTDANNCEQAAVFTVSEPSPIELTLTPSELTCPDDTDGSITLEVSGGTPEYTYAWSGPDGFSSANQNLTGLAQGQYAVVVTDANGCEQSASTEILATDTMVPEATITPIACAEEETGSIAVVVSGGTPDYQFSWSGPNGFSSNNANISNLAAGTYVLLITDANDCTTQLEVTLDEPPLLELDGSTEDLTCPGLEDGSIELTITGGTAPYEVLWSGPDGFSSTDTQLSGLSEGTYTVLVTDSLGCTEEASFTLETGPGPEVSAVVTNANCATDDDGSIETEVTGGTPPYTYSWTGPGGFVSDQADLFGLGSGVYELTLTDSAGCVTEASYTINNPSPIEISGTVTDILCAGENNGAINIEITGDTGPITIVWSGPDGFSSNDQSIANLAAGTYTVVVIDEQDCVVQEQFVVNEPPLLELSLDVQLPDCDENNGVLTAIVSGGSISGDYTYLWTDGDNNIIGTGSSVANLGPGTYTITVADDNGCTVSETVTLQDSDLEVDAVISQPQCAGDENGSIDVTISGGVPPYNIAWSGPDGFTSTAAFIDNLAAGAYVLTVTDSLNCVLIETFQLDEPPAISIILSPVNPLCFGDSNGTIASDVSGGTAPYTYSWSGPAGYSSNAPNISDLAAGSYVLLVTDSLGCSEFQEVTLTAPEEIIVDASITDVLCGDENTGVIAINISGGTPGYVVNWTGPDGFASGDFNIDNLAAGTYNLSLVDNAFCNFNTSFVVDGNDPIEGQFDVFPVSCFGDEDGAIVTTISGGVEPLELSWTGPDGFTSNEANLSDLVPGDYTLLVTDSLGCTLDTTITLVEPEAIELELDVVQPACLQNDGSIALTILGGTAPYTITWQDEGGVLPITDTLLTGLSSGFYSVEVVDAAGCSASEEVLLSDLGGEILADIANVSCAGDFTGVIATTVLNAIPPFTYAWTGPNGFTADTPDIINLEAGVYVLVVTDSLGCITVDDFEITEPEPLVFDIEVSQISCFGNNGAIALTPSGGTPPYEVEWIGPDGFTSTSPGIADLAEGLYVAVITDALGCAQVVEVQLAELDPLILILNAEDILCNGDNNGSIEASITGGLAPYNITWVGPDTFVQDSLALTNLGPGFYEVQVTDANGCIANAEVSITEPPALEVVLDVTPTTCALADGGATLTVSGGTVSDDYTYTWLAADSTVLGTDPSITGLAPGLYFAVVSDDNNCTWNTPFVIEDEDVEILADITMPSCGIGNDGAISVEVLGGTPPYAYTWTGPDGFTANTAAIFNLEAGVYFVTVTDSLNCQYADFYELEIPETVFLSFEVSPITCNGDNDGGIELFISGGTPPYEVLWSGPDGFVSSQTILANLAPGTYSVTVADSLLCTAFGQVTLNDPVPLMVQFEVTDNLCATDTSGVINTTASGGYAPYTYQWIGPNGFTANEADLSDLAPGFYELLLTDSAGCTAMFAAEVGSTPPLEFEIMAQQALCFGDANGQLTAMVSGGTPDYNYNWSGPDGFASNDSSISNLFAGEYLLLVSDSNGCALDTMLVLNQPDSLQISIPVLDLLCAGDSSGAASAEVTGGTEPYTYNWSSEDGFADTSATVSGLMPGIYTVLVVDTLGCTTQQEAEIAEPPALDVEVLSITDALCSNDDSGEIEVLASGGTPGYTYIWSGPNGFEAQGEAIEGLLPGDYLLTVNDSNGCALDTIVEVDFLLEIGADAGADTALCFDAQPLVLVGTPSNATEVFWTDSAGNEFSSQDTLVIFFPPGTYTFFYTAANGLCTSTDTVTVVIHALPDVDAGPDVTIVEGESVELGGSPTSSTAIQHLWMPFETLSDSLVPNPIASPEQTTEYIIVVADINGCSNTDTVLVTVVPDIFIPTGISPNGDGINDTWIIDHIEQFPGNQVEIYNRWGDRLFSVQGYDNNNPWEGFHNGKALPVGTYYYIIELNDERFPEPRTGPITIFR